MKIVTTLSTIVMLSFAVILTLTVVTVPARPEGNGVEIWTASNFKTLEQELSSKLDAQKFAARNLGTFDNHSFMLAHREGSGQAELHERQHDLFLVENGHATLLVGGTMVGPNRVASHEIRGSSISGGERKALGAGDVAYIPAGTPHQLLLDAGKRFTYFVAKIDVK